LKKEEDNEGHRGAAPAPPRGGGLSGRAAAARTADGEPSGSDSDGAADQQPAATDNENGGTCVPPSLPPPQLPRPRPPEAEEELKKEEDNEGHRGAAPAPPRRGGLSGVGSVVDHGRVVRPGIVHRLDRGTSGLLVVAKDDHAHQHLMRQFAERRTRRRYVALVHGCPDPPEGTVRAGIARDRLDRTRMAVVSDAEVDGGRGKHAITHYKLLRRLAHASVVEFVLETGRTHQVRVHAAHLGLPLLGDATYGGAPLPAAGPRSADRVERFRTLFSRTLLRPALHARSLGFRHPYTGKPLDFSCRPHSDMVAAWAALAACPDEGKDSGWLCEGCGEDGWG